MTRFRDPFPVPGRSDSCRGSGGAVDGPWLSIAIVLAAIVGDGKSAAAGLLKGLGLTFEGAIRALQRANAEARVKAAGWGPGETARPDLSKK